MKTREELKDELIYQLRQMLKLYEAGFKNVNPACIRIQRTIKELEGQIENAKA